MAPDAAQGQLPCPVCGKPSDSLKQYRLRHVLFLGIAGSVKYESITACPACMRARIYHVMGVSLLSANVLWPFVLPIHAAMALMTLSRGHSPDIAAELRHKARLRVLQDSIRHDGSTLDEAKLALLRGDRALAFEIAKTAAAANNDPSDPHTKLMNDIFENRI